DRAGSGVRARQRTGAAAANTRATQVRVQEASNTRATRTKRHSRHTWARVLKSWCQLNYQDGCALAGLIGQYSPGGIGSDRPSEKRKVDSSILSLTTSSDQRR